MANRRSLHKSISYSEQVDSLSERAQLLFTWMIPHLDDFGRISGSPAKVGAMVVPLKLNRPGWSIADIEGYLTEMEGARDEAGVPLLVRYVADGIKVAWMPKFDLHQDGLHKRTKSKWPDPPEDILKGSFPEVPGSSGKCTEIPHEEKGNEVKHACRAHEENQDEPPEPRFANQAQDEPSFAIAARMLEQALGRPLNTGMEVDWLTSVLDEWPLEIVLEAIKRMTLRGGRHVRFADKLLADWRNAKCRSLADVIAFEERRDAARKPRAPTPEPQGRYVPGYEETMRMLEEGR